MLNFQIIWFWTQIYLIKHGTILSIKQLIVENMQNLPISTDF